jgi:hypothetical protein
MNVLPPFLRPTDITRAIAMEYQWVQEIIACHAAPEGEAGRIAD